MAKHKPSVGKAKGRTKAAPAIDRRSTGQLSATIDIVDGRHVLAINAEAEDILIPLSEDNPSEVKSAFNKLIARVKDGSIEIKLEKVGDDLFSQVANEYITQLNRELREVRGEMKKYGLVQ